MSLSFCILCVSSSSLSIGRVASLSSSSCGKGEARCHMQIAWQRQYRQDRQDESNSEIYCKSNAAVQQSKNMVRSKCFLWVDQQTARFVINSLEVQVRSINMQCARKSDCSRQRRLVDELASTKYILADFSCTHGLDQIVVVAVRCECLLVA